MNIIIYNISLAVGIILIFCGVAAFSLPGALIAVGALVIALTLAGAYLSRKG